MESNPTQPTSNRTSVSVSTSCLGTPKPPKPCRFTQSTARTPEDQRLSTHTYRLPIVKERAARARRQHGFRAAKRRDCSTKRDPVNSPSAAEKRQRARLVASIAKIVSSPGPGAPGRRFFGPVILRDLARMLDVAARPLDRSRTRLARPPRRRRSGARVAGRAVSASAGLHAGRFSLGR